MPLMTQVQVREDQLLGPCRWISLHAWPAFADSAVVILWTADRILESINCRSVASRWPRQHSNGDNTAEVLSVFLFSSKHSLAHFLLASHVSGMEQIGSCWVTCYKQR